MVQTRTIVDTLRKKTMPQFKAVAAVERSLERTLPVIQDSQKDISKRTEALERLANRVITAAAEVKEEATAIRRDSNVIDIAIGRMLESKDALGEFIEKLAQYSTLMVNLKEVFFRSDPKILHQVLEEIDPVVRREAWKNLDPALREMIKAELEQVR